MGKDYFASLDADQTKFIRHLIKRMREKGLTNPFTQAGILAVVSKECEFRPRTEKDYSNTKDNAYIQGIFVDRLGKYTLAEIDVLKKDPYKFFEAIYGKDTLKGQQGGNVDEGDGFKFRGQGPNQITFRKTFAKIGKQIGVDLEAHPEKINEMEVGTDATLQYFFNCFAAVPKKRLDQYHTAGINEFKTATDAAKMIYHANAGWGKNVLWVGELTAGKIKTLGRVEGFLNIVNSIK